MRQHPLRAEDHRLDLVGREHERRHVEPAFENIAYPRLAADRNALGDQRPNIPVDRPPAGLQLRGDRGCGKRPRCAAENLNDLEQAIAAAHQPSATRIVLEITLPSRKNGALIKV